MVTGEGKASAANAARAQRLACGGWGALALTRHGGFGTSRPTSVSPNTRSNPLRSISRGSSTPGSSHRHGGRGVDHRRQLEGQAVRLPRGDQKPARANAAAAPPPRQDVRHPVAEHWHRLVTESAVHRAAPILDAAGSAAASPGRSRQNCEVRRADAGQTGNSTSRRRSRRAAAAEWRRAAAPACPPTGPSAVRVIG